jgi:hypothetical protein
VKPAPAFDCAMCGRRIGRGRTHWVLRELPRRVICSACTDKRDLYGRIGAHGSRAGIAAHLGLWP